MGFERGLELRTYKVRMVTTCVYHTMQECVINPPVDLSFQVGGLKLIVKAMEDVRYIHVFDSIYCLFCHDTFPRTCLYLYLNV